MILAPGSAQKAQRTAQQSGRDLVPDDATGCDEERPPPKTAQALTLYELRACASQCETMRSGGQGIRTLNRLPGT